MATPSRDRTVRGTARVAFIAHLATISTELEQGHTAQAIYQRHHGKLGGSISYQQFARYVRQLRDNGLVQPPLGRPAPPMSAQPAPAQPRALPPHTLEPKPQPASPPASPPGPQPAPEAPPLHARHQPPPRTFAFDPNPKQDDKSRLIGGPRRDPKA